MKRLLNEVYKGKNSRQLPLKYEVSLLQSSAFGSASCTLTRSTQSMKFEALPRPTGFFLLILL